MHAHPSILSLEQLGRRTREWRREGRRVVLCHGTFDLLHMGHIRHLQRARREGDVLVVTLTGAKSSIFWRNRTSTARRSPLSSSRDGNGMTLAPSRTEMRFPSSGASASPVLA